MERKENPNPHSPYINNFSYERQKKEWAQSYYSRTASCYGCSRAVRELIIPKNEYEEQYDNIRDVKFKCPMLMQLKKEVTTDCKIGDRKYREHRCDHCVHGSYTTDIHLIPKSHRDGTTIHRMYKCDLPDDSGFLYRGYYSCESFEPKEDNEK